MRITFTIFISVAAVALMSCRVGLAQDDADSVNYAVPLLPPGGPAPRLADGRPDLSGHWFPNGAGQGVSGRFGVDPAALGTFDPEVTPEEPPVFQAWALERIESMTPTEPRTIEVFGQLYAARCARDLAPESLFDPDVSYAGYARAAL